MQNLPTSLARNTSLGGITLAVILGVAVVAFFWTPHDIVSGFDVSKKLEPPSLAHWLGTDHLGRDVLSQLMLGAQVSLWVAIAAVSIGVGVGVPLGLVAVAFGGRVDELIMRACDVSFAFPALVLAIILTAVLGPGLPQAIIAIGVFNIPVFARLTRGAAGAIMQSNFVRYARVAGKRDWRIAIDHILPNIAHIISVHATIQVSLGIVVEAGLSYVGLSAQPPTPSWGRMLAESQTLAADAPWLAVAPGLAIVLTVLALNAVGTQLQRHFGITDLRTAA